MKIVQIAATTSAFYALSEDGRIFVNRFYRTKEGPFWEEVAPPVEPRVAETPVTEGECEKHPVIKEIYDGEFRAFRLSVCSCRVAGGKSGDVDHETGTINGSSKLYDEFVDRVASSTLDEAITVVEKNGGDKTVLAALKELANR